MRVVLGFIKASHPLPTIAVSLVISAFGWSLGWTGLSLVAVFATILVGQLSVGWSNDAHDANLDARIGRSTKPTVTQDVSARALWLAALTALLIAIASSWAVAGWLGGSFHIFAILMAWLYNIRLSRTAWSWLPYSLAFGAMPAVRLKPYARNLISEIQPDLAKASTRRCRSRQVQRVSGGR